MRGGALALLVALGAIGGGPATAATAKAPVLGRTALVAPVSGQVSIRRPAATAFVPLTAPTLIPFGTTVRTTAGVVRVTTATPQAGQTQSAEFYAGQFRLTQAATGATNLALNAPLGCPAHGPRIASASHSKKKATTRSLWGSGHGDFTTSGHYAAATVVGTKWLTTDSCSGTQVTVATGHVDVTNLVTHSTVMLAAGHTVGVAPSGVSSSITVTTTNAAPKLGQRYTITVAGSAGGPGTAYMFENVGVPCAPTLAAEQATAEAFHKGTKTLTAAGPFTLSTTVIAQHTGTKYWCGYTTNPPASAQLSLVVS